MTSKRNNMPKRMDLQECQLLIRHSLFEAMFQRGWQRAGLFPLINRSILIAQPTLAPVIYQSISRKSLASRSDEPWREVCKKGRCFTRIFNPIFDRRNSSEFERLLSNCERRLHLKGRQLSFLKADHHAKLIPAFGNDFYVMLWKLDAISEVTLGAEPIGRENKNKEVWFCFRQILKKRNGDPDVGSALNINKSLITIGTLRENCKDELLIAGDEVRRVHAVAERAVGAVTTILDDVYRVYGGSSLLQVDQTNRVDQAGLANLMFFWKVIDRTTERCGVYTHDARCIVPSSQRDHLSAALDRRWVELLSAPRLVDRSGAVSKVDNEVRLLLRSNNRRMEIVEAIEGRAPDCERLMVEHTLSSGLINARKNPFALDRLSRVEPYGKDVERAQFRAVCLRYILLLMRPVRLVASGDKVDLVNWSVLQIPLRVGGAPAGCMTMLRRQDNVDSQVLDSKSFFDTYHFYHSICKHAIRQVRIKSRARYAQLVAELIRERLLEGLGQAVSSSTASYPIYRVLQNINLDLAALCRVFPFRMVQVQNQRHVHEPGTPSSTTVPILHHIQAPTPHERDTTVVSILRDKRNGILVQIYDNPVFDRTGEESFFEIEHVAPLIRSQLLQLEASDEYKMLSVQLTNKSKRRGASA